MKRILLIEDDPLLIDIYLTKLKEAGFSVDVAKEGEDVLNKIKEKKPDLLLLDIVLPQIDGWEILRKIKEDSEIKGLKIIVFSNLGQRREVEKGLELGATKYLIKAHYNPSEVVKEIRETLEVGSGKYEETKKK